MKLKLFILDGLDIVAGNLTDALAQFHSEQGHYPAIIEGPK